jgi:hypothetical protein
LSVWILTKVQGRQPASQIMASTSVIFMVYSPVWSPLPLGEGQSEGFMPYH